MVFQQQPELFQTLPEPFDTLGKLPAISCPVLVMHGDKEMDPDGTWHIMALLVEDGTFVQK